MKGEASETLNSNVVSPKVQRRAKVVLYSLVVVILGYYFGDLHFYRTIDCTVVSAEAVSGGGGLRSSTSRQSINTDTEECGRLVFVEMQNEGFDSASDLADELNRHRGERLTFHISYFQLKNHEARAVELEGYPIRD